MLFSESGLGLLGNSLLDCILSEVNAESSKKATGHKMLTDIRETEEGYELAIEVPGFEKEDLKLELKDGYLTVIAEREKEAEEKGKMIRQERYCGISKRSFYVGKQIEKEDVSAKYEKGILNIFVPKKEKVETKQSIEIQ